MNQLSTENLELFPSPEQLQRICKSIATLDAIICPEWEFRYYSYQKNWSAEEAVFSMRDGQGDQLFILFAATGTCINGFAHESSMNGWEEVVLPQKQSVFGKIFGPKQAVKTVSQQRIAKGVVDDLPAVFNEFIFGEPIKSIGTTFCIWQIGSSNWKTGIISLPQDNCKDGSSDLLRLLDGNPANYKAWAEAYYEEEFEERELRLEVVEKIYGHVVLTKEMVESINSSLEDYEKLKTDLDEIGYPAEL